MNYPVVIHKDKGSDDGVTVPDLPGCFSAGAVMDEALAMAQEAIELHLEGLIDEGRAVPAAGKIERHHRNPDYFGGTWAVVTINPSGQRIKARRINVTIRERVLDAIDRHAAAVGETRSGLLAQAATEFIGRRGDEALASAQRKCRPGGRRGKPARSRGD